MFEELKLNLTLFLDEPGRTSKPVIDDFDISSASLIWEKPEQDGGRPITHYIIEMKDKMSLEWTPVLTTPDEKCAGTVTGLKENQVVQFRVRAGNKAGVGDASEPTENHLVKHRNLAPRIDRNALKTVTIKAGRSHKWAVDVRGEPPPTMVWCWRDDVPLSNTARITIENTDNHTEFTLVEAVRKDGGKYTLKAENANGKDKETVELIVLGKPSSPKGPLEVSGVHKEGCILKWQKPEDDGGMPIKEYEIEKMDTATGKWVRVGKVGGERSPPTYNVTGLEPGHSYQFRVTASNAEGDSEPLETEHATVAKNPWTEALAPGQPVITDYDHESVNLKWTPPQSDGGAPIDKYIIEKKDKYKPDWEKAGEVAGNVLEAKIGDLKERAEYQFRIVAVNIGGQSPPSEATGMHLVKHKLLKPKIDRTNLRQTTIKASKIFKFDVNIKGEPPPTVQWFLADKEVVTADNVEVINVEYNTKLNVIDAKRKDSGLYKIVATNEHGTDEAEVEVLVLAPPTKPKGPLKVTDVTKTGCKLAWQAPEDDGGKPITGYVVEKLDKGRWVPVGKSKEPEMEVGKLQEGNEYQFRVRAINDEGESDALETEHAIIAKNPFGNLLLIVDVEILV